MRKKIIGAAIESLRREGLRFSVDTLAERLRISKKTIYKYFPTKEALAMAMYEEFYRAAEEAAGPLVRQEDTEGLLRLYFESKRMTRPDIFNKYKLNEALSAFARDRNDRLWGLIAPVLLRSCAAEDRPALRLIIDGTFEKTSEEPCLSSEIVRNLVKVLC